VEKRARRSGVEGEQLRLLREQASQPVLTELHEYLLKIRDQVLPKSEAGQAVSYARQRPRRPDHGRAAKLRRVPFAWFQDVLSRIGAHSIQQLDELLPHRWAAAR